MESFFSTASLVLVGSLYSEVMVLMGSLHLKGKGKHCHPCSEIQHVTGPAALGQSQSCAQLTCDPGPS